MIAYLQGKLLQKDPASVILDVQGVGYELRISLNTFGSLQDEESCRLHTYLHIKEDAHTLYGFFTLEEKRSFLYLIAINGVGPNTALMVLSTLQPAEFRHAILSEDVKTIQSVKGIGAKTAQRIILELKDKLEKEDGPLPTTAEQSAPSHNSVKQEALSALVTLGFARAGAEKTVEAILKKHGQNLSLENLIKLALKTA